MEAWIQRHDGSMESISAPTVACCLDVLQSFDWESELASYEEALADNRTRCPPALGLADEDRVLQVMPIRGGCSHYSYSCDHPLRVLAFFGASTSLNAWAIGDEHREDLVGCHFGGEQERLVGALCRLTQTEGRTPEGP